MPSFPSVMSPLCYYIIMLSSNSFAAFLLSNASVRVHLPPFTVSFYFERTVLKHGKAVWNIAINSWKNTKREMIILCGRKMKITIICVWKCKRKKVKKKNSDIAAIMIGWYPVMLQCRTRTRVMCNFQIRRKSVQIINNKWLGIFSFAFSSFYLSWMAILLYVFIHFCSYGCFCPGCDFTL